METVAFGVRGCMPRDIMKKKKKNSEKPVRNQKKMAPLPEERGHAELQKMKKKKKKLPHEEDNVEGEINPCKPTAFMGFFKPALVAKAREEPNPQGEITMTNPGAFLDFFRPIKWIRQCPARRDEVYSPLPPPDPKKVPRVKRKRWRRRPRGFKTRRGWFCEQAGLKIRKGRQENFLNYSPEELEVVRKIAERKKAKVEAKYNRMYKSYTKGLENKKGHIMRLMSDLVTITDERYHTKHALLYEQWRTQVFEYIQRQIEDSLDLISPDYLKDKLRWYHYQYMGIANKQMILLDFPRPDYDPFESLKYTIKYSMKELVDPVKHDLTKENVEKRFMGDHVSDSVVTKETLGLRHWPAYHFRGTVWGHIEADEEDGSEIVIKQPEKLYSHDLLYNQVFVGGEYVKAEFPRGRYIVPNKGMLPQNHIDKPEGKAMVWDVECQTQPKLRLWYN